MGLLDEIGKIAAWAVAEGDRSTKGDDLADIETDKIAGTLEAAGRRARPPDHRPLGEDLPVGAAIALLAPAEVADADLDAAIDMARAVIAPGRRRRRGAAAAPARRVGGRKITY